MMVLLSSWANATLRVAAALARGRHTQSTSRCAIANAPRRSHAPPAVFTLIVLVCVLTGPGCARDIGWPAVQQMIHSDFPEVSQITTDSLARRLQDKQAPRPVLLDVRAPQEYAVSHLQGARRVSPEAQASDSTLRCLPHDTTIVTYCSVGYRSSALAERLEKAGYTNVSNLKGSIFRWANEKRPVYRNGKRVRKVHPYNQLWGTLLNDDLHAR